MSAAQGVDIILTTLDGYVFVTGKLHPHLQRNTLICKCACIHDEFVAVASVRRFICFFENKPLMKIFFHGR